VLLHHSGFQITDAHIWANIPKFEKLETLKHLWPHEFQIMDTQLYEEMIISYSGGGHQEDCSLNPA
jgi:hypothetical protein